MSTVPTWLGDLPTWITTLAIAIAAAQFVFERRRRRAEENRESKAQASELIAWTVTDVKPPRVYGVVVSNSSRSAFHDVTITLRLHGSETERPIQLDILPPGTYFVRHNGHGATHTWDFAVDASSYAGWLRPYMKSDKYRVTSIEFSDNLEQQWRASEHLVLTKIERTTARG